MVAGRRFGPLIVLVVIGLVVLLVRMYQVQVDEHEAWAGEARNLARSGSTIPYLRGRITDRGGEVFVRDEEAYAVEFIYRDFRRRHPLGQIAHARSALEDRGVGLDEAVHQLESWGMALVLARAEDVERFARGEPVRLCGIDFPAVEPGEDRRRSRAADLRFYTQGLIGAAPRDWSSVKKRIKKGRAGEQSFVELIAEQEGGSPDEVRERVRQRVQTSLERLAQLAVQLGVRGEDDALAIDSEEALQFLISALDDQRCEIEDRVAVDLFIEATGFHPGRLESGLLSEMIDLAWIAEQFGWSTPRLESWIDRVRAEYLEDLRTFHAPAAGIRARLRVREGSEPLFDALFGELAVLWARRPRTPSEWRARREPASRDWRGIDELAVFSEREDLLEDLELGVREAPLPFVDAELRAARARAEDPGVLFEEMIPLEFAAEVEAGRSPEPDFDWRGRQLDPWEPPRAVEEASARLRVLFGWKPPPGTLSKPDSRDARDLVPWIAALWERRFQATLRTSLGGAASRAAARQMPLPLKLTKRRLDSARNKADYSTRDRSSRPEIIDDEPGDPVILYLTRYADEYRGFDVLQRTTRQAIALDSDDDLIARELIGVVRESTLEEVIEQQRPRRRLSEIVHQGTRDDAEDEEFDELVSSLYRNDEVHGTSGIEGLCDAALRGVNGYRENQGLQEREESGHDPVTKYPVDGLDVQLTLSIDLQLAAQHTIERPYLPQDEKDRDEVWFQNPVGAIVLATVDGEILAAASAPKGVHEATVNRDNERAFHYDRTLRRPEFQPVGSIFKPFVAAYALDRKGLDPGQEFRCDPRAGSGTAGWGKVACWRTYGHLGISLVDAIQDSCNSYFAQVGELLEDQDGVRELARMFGFDRPSGVRSLGSGRGLAEDSHVHALQADIHFSQTLLNRAGNGLEVIEASPVQVARAVAGLATGRLPTMRLVRAIDGEPVLPSFEPIPLQASVLSMVRQAMVGVVREGSASGKGLSREKLHFTLAGKTGSADYEPMSDEYRAQLQLTPGSRPQMRKHTWFVGFFPAEEPRAVVVIYCHDIGVTASHSAVHVAAQFLKTPEVQSFVKGALR